MNSYFCRSLGLGRKTVPPITKVGQTLAEAYYLYIETARTICILKTFYCIQPTIYTTKVYCL